MSAFEDLASDGHAPTEVMVKAGVVRGDGSFARAMQSELNSYRNELIEQINRPVLFAHVKPSPPPSRLVRVIRRLKYIVFEEGICTCERCVLHGYHEDPWY